MEQQYAASNQQRQLKQGDKREEHNLDLFYNEGIL